MAGRLYCHSFSFKALKSGPGDPEIHRHSPKENVERAFFLLKEVADVFSEEQGSSSLGQKCQRLGQNLGYCLWG
jgi:hypothetical protein